MKTNSTTASVLAALKAKVALHWDGYSIDGVGSYRLSELPNNVNYVLGLLPKLWRYAAHPDLAGEVVEPQSPVVESKLPRPTGIRN